MLNKIWRKNEQSLKNKSHRKKIKSLSRRMKVEKQIVKRKIWWTKVEELNLKLQSEKRKKLKVEEQNLMNITWGTKVKERM